MSGGQYPCCRHVLPDVECFLPATTLCCCSHCCSVRVYSWGELAPFGSCSHGIIHSQGLISQPLAATHLRPKRTCMQKTSGTSTDFSLDISCTALQVLRSTTGFRCTAILKHSKSYNSDRQPLHEGITNKQWMTVNIVLLPVSLQCQKQHASSCCTRYLHHPTGHHATAANHISKQNQPLQAAWDEHSHATRGAGQITAAAVLQAWPLLLLLTSMKVMHSLQSRGQLAAWASSQTCRARSRSPAARAALIAAVYVYTVGARPAPPTAGGPFIQS